MRIHSRLTVWLVSTVCLLGSSAPDTSAQALPTEPTGGVLTLRDALTLVVAHNPRLAAFALDVRIRDALTTQASLRPNPDLSLEMENFAGTSDFSGFDRAEITLSVAQLFELGGKRSKRQDLALLEEDLATWDYEAQRLEVLTEATRAFIALVAIQEQMQLADDIVGIATQDLAAVQRRVKAGAASPIETTRAQIALATVKMNLATATQKLIAARAKLSAMWGSHEPSFETAVGDLESIAPPPALAELEPRLAANPDLARWDAELAQREAALALAQALGKIDLTAAGGFRRLEESDDNVWVVGLSIPLPLSDRNQGAVQAAQYRMARAAEERRATIVSAHAELTAGHAALTAAFQEVRGLQMEILPGMQDAMDATEDAFLKGLFNFTDVLAVRKSYYDLRSRYFESLARYHSEIAEIERLVGGELFVSEQEQEQQ